MTIISNSISLKILREQRLNNGVILEGQDCYSLLSELWSLLDTKKNKERIQEIQQIFLEFFNIKWSDIGKLLSTPRQRHAFENTIREYEATLA